MKEVLNKIFLSFKKATKGEELMIRVIWFWGVIGYIFAFAVANKLIRTIDFRFFDILISLVMTLYFSWHIYAVKKCSPKKPKLNPEKKDKLNAENRVNLGKSVARKLLLQEPLTKWNSTFMITVIDILCITHFFGYIFR
ncbi:MAG: hypothetical protein KGP29_05710 [Proteobacteria bacterium]|nr:hypothetical protein [Pseudomonadota bacterium]